MNRKVAIIGTVGLPANYGGFETLAEHLVNQKSKEFQFAVYCSNKAYSVRPSQYNGATLKYLPLNANGIQSIFYDIWSILLSLKTSDTLLILGVSGCIILPFIKIISRDNIVVNIDGLEWKRAKWGKLAKRYLKFSERLAVKYADVIIADNKVIQEHVESTYRKKAELIAYGADHTEAQAISSQTLGEFPFLEKPYAFKVCRIEPENNIHLILDAFWHFQNLNLVIVGNWNNSDYARNLKTEFGNLENIFLLNSIYDQDKLNELRSNCCLYVHGHSAGGTNPSLVEAMYLKLPILAYGINYNRETTHNQAIYFEDRKSLIRALENLDLKKSEEVAKAMYKIAEKNYTWKKVADQYAQFF